MRDGVGLSEISSFAKYKVTGEGASAWLDRLLACKLPKPGRMTLAPMLKDDGRLIGDFTLANLGSDGWFLAGSGIAEQYHMRWFEAHLPGDGSVHIEALGAKLTGLAIAGPKAREVLAKVSRADVSNAAFPFMKKLVVSLFALLAGTSLAMCARVCPTETLCEEVCVREVAEGKPVQIGRLQRYATDVAMGEDAHTKIANVTAALEGGILAPVELLLRLG